MVSTFFGVAFGSLRFRCFSVGWNHLLTWRWFGGDVGYVDLHDVSLFGQSFPCLLWYLESTLKIEWTEDSIFDYVDVALIPSELLWIFV